MTLPTARRARSPSVPGHRLSLVQTEAAERTVGRQGPVWQLLAGALASLGADGVTPHVLDCGGGSGTYAVPLARRGAEVTVVDVSVDALATLGRRAEEAGVGPRVRGVQGDVESLADVVDDARFDLVLAHGILEEVDHVAAAFDAITATVRPGGLLSILVSNPVAVVIGRALAGDLGAALAELRALAGPERLGAGGVEDLCRSRGLLVESRAGVGVFTEFVPGSAIDAPGAREVLDQLEAEAGARVPFVDLASRVHVLARRPSG
jgi:SAM-dependent methyltransferase